jgi:voltage-gated potassium channel
MYLLKTLYKWLSERKIIQVSILKALAVGVIFNLLFGIGFYFAERGTQAGLTLWDSIWWAMVTMTTVGYGDYSAVTPTGRFLISYPCMVLGIGIIGYLIGVVAESMLERVSKKKRGLMDISERNHILICNCPAIPKVLLLVKEIRANPEYEARAFVVISDGFNEMPEEFKARRIQFVKGDPTREEILMKANVTACAGVFILAEDPKNATSDEKTFAIGTIIEMLKKENNLSLKVVVELVSKDNLKMMKRSNVDGIVTPDGITDCLMAQEFVSPGVHDIIQQIISNTIGNQIYIFETRLRNHKVSDIQVAVLKHPASMQVIGIVKQEKQILNPPKNMLIEKGDKLIMLAESAEDFRSIEDDVLKNN